MEIRGSTFSIFLMLSAIVLVYLLVSAPPPLPESDGESRGAAKVSVNELLALCAAENAVVRSLYTQEIVGAGQNVGLQFAENWRTRGVEAGPLPALFLRETAGSLEKDPVRLGLFLGSDFPINQANLFKGRQAEMFQKMRAERAPLYFFLKDVELYAAMFPDLAVAPACVSCHNEHPDTRKTDWKLGDVMGATTWTYPGRSVSVDEMLEVVAALRRGFRDVYTAYLQKAQTFQSPPAVGDLWPREGYFLPSPDVFMQEAERRASAHSMRRLLAIR